MHFLFALLVSALLLGCQGCSPLLIDTGAYPSVDTSIDVLRDSTIALLQKRETGGYRVICSGVWLSPTVMATAAHCLTVTMDDEEELLYDALGMMPVDMVGRRLDYGTFSDLKDGSAKIDSARTAVIAALDVTADLAVLSATEFRLDHSSVALGARPLTGQHVMAVGHPAGLTFSYAEGVVAAVRQMKNAAGFTTEIVQVAAPGIYFGNSGSGLYDHNGRLLGICSFTIPNATHITFYSSVEKLRELLEREAIDV